MSFQLVRASDDSIAVWQTDHGHIYVYAISTDGLRQIVMREAPDAGEPATVFAEEALRFATAEARARKMIGSEEPQDRSTARA